MVTLLGRNGAGKTTTLKSIMGIVGQRTGSVWFEGSELIRLTSDRIARLGIALCPEERGIFASLTVEENLLLPPNYAPAGSNSTAYSSSSPIQGTAVEPGHQAFRGRAADARHRTHPAYRRRLLLLDGATEGLAPVIIQQIGKTIGLLKQQGFTILLVEQNFRFASTVADRYYVMEHGRIIDQFANTELEANLDKLHVYLGV